MTAKKLPTDDTLPGAGDPLTGLPALGTNVWSQTQQLFVQQAGTTNAVSMADVNQGTWGDCYLCAGMDEMIRKSPSFITKMLHQNADGTVSVKLYEDAATNAPVTLATTAFKPVTEIVDPKALQQGGCNTVSPFQDCSFGGFTKEIWPQVIEQAYAQLNGGIPNIINGGLSAVAMATMSGIGQQAVIQPSAFNVPMLQRLINYNCEITFDTLPYNDIALTNGLVGNHSYAYNGFNVKDQTIDLVNPWGTGNPTPVKVTDVWKDFSMIEVAHASH